VIKGKTQSCGDRNEWINEPWINAMCVKQGKDISTFSNVSPSRVQSIVTDDEKKNNRQETKYRDDEKGEMLAVFV